MIIVEPCAGLGNRFLSLASAYHWAREVDEELVVLWKTESAMGAHNKEIFTIPSDIRIVNAKDYGYKVHPFAQLRYENLKKKYKKEADFFIDVSELMDLFKQKGKEGVEQIIKDNKVKYLRAFYEFYPLEKTDAPLGFIKPSEKVLKKMYDTIGDSDCSDTIGIHIRRADNQVCINNSPLELFIEKMKKEVEQNDKTKFYLASDDQQTLDELSRMFGKRIMIMKEKNFARDNAEGIIDAYAELMCLSHSKKIIGSFYSSYSKIAAMISQIPLEILQIENLIPW